MIQAHTVSGVPQGAAVNTDRLNLNELKDRHDKGINAVRELAPSWKNLFSGKRRSMESMTLVEQARARESFAWLAHEITRINHAHQTAGFYYTAPEREWLRRLEESYRKASRMGKKDVRFHAKMLADVNKVLARFDKMGVTHAPSLSHLGVLE
jgi:hypothetical protein